LSAIRYPQGVDAALLTAVKEEGVIVAGGLHPSCKHEYFRVGHMGFSALQIDWLRRTITAIEKALVRNGHRVEPNAGVTAFEEAMSSQTA
jgi:alanine-glyoxylate transaminase/serine-glyoxylate transaminase/serine-pyruvate transaminase